MVYQLVGSYCIELLTPFLWNLPSCANVPFDILCCTFVANCYCDCSGLAVFSNFGCSLIREWTEQVHDVDVMSYQPSWCGIDVDATLHKRHVPCLLVMHLTGGNNVRMFLLPLSVGVYPLRKGFTACLCLLDSFLFGWTHSLESLVYGATKVTKGLPHLKNSRKKSTICMST